MSDETPAADLAADPAAAPMLAAAAAAEPPVVAAAEAPPPLPPAVPVEGTPAAPAAPSALSAAEGTPAAPAAPSALSAAEGIPAAPAAPSALSAAEGIPAAPAAPSALSAAAPAAPAAALALAPAPPSAPTVPKPNQGQEELLFLVADFLDRSTACSGAAALLKRELEQHGLLGRRTDYTGSHTPATFDSTKRKFAKLPASQLQDVLATALVSTGGWKGLLCIHSGDWRGHPLGVVRGGRGRPGSGEANAHHHHPPPPSSPPPLSPP